MRSGVLGAVISAVNAHSGLSRQASISTFFCFVTYILPDQRLGIIHTDMALFSDRMDRIEGRLERVEARLNLTDA
jgi:hypothetical protein